MSIIRDKKRKKSEYHGYGPDGYKPGPRHGVTTNLDLIAHYEETMNRCGIHHARHNRPNS